MVLNLNFSNKPEGQVSAQIHRPHDFSLHGVENSVTACIDATEELSWRSGLLCF